MKYLLLFVSFLLAHPAFALPEDDRDFNNLTRIAVLPTDTRVESVAFSPDEKLLAAGLNNRILIWDEKPERLKTLELDDNARTINEAGTNPADPLRPAQQKDRWVLALAFSPDSKSLTAACSDGTVRQWNVETEKEIIFSDPDLSKARSPLLSHKDVVNTVIYSRDGKQIVSGSSDRTAKVWEAESGRLLHRLGGHVFQVFSVAFSNDNSTIVTLGAKSLGRSASDFGKVTGEFKEWNAASGELTQSVSVRDFNDLAATLSPDGRVAVCQRFVYQPNGSYGVAMTFWNAHTGEYVRPAMKGRAIDSYLTVGGAAAFSYYGGALLAVGPTEAVPPPFNPSVRPTFRWPHPYPAIRLWDVASGQERLKLKAYDSRNEFWSLPPVRNLAISRTAKEVAFACNNGSVEVWAVP